MHGYGMFGDLLHLALYLLAIAAWFYFWLICMFYAKVSLARILGAHAFLICALAVPGIAAGLLGAAMVLFGLEYIVWSLLVLGVALPLLGARFITHSRPRRYYFDRRR